MVKILTKGEFDNFLQANGDRLSVIKFSAPWCGPCKLLGGIIEELEPIEGVVFGEVNVDDADEDFVNEFNVRNIPTVLFFKNGMQVDRTTGAMGRDAFENKINENKNK